MVLEGQLLEHKRKRAPEGDERPRARVRLRLASDERLVASLRRGEQSAYEALYDRHAAELLAFCTYMLSSRADAEDAVQATFASAYRALGTDDRPLTLRPWLFAIARNHCLTILRKRRPTVELNGEPALRGDPARELELREEVHDTFLRLRELPEQQRAAMVLAEVRGLSQAEIGDVLGVRADQVKALVYQARSDLISERRARETGCNEIRAEIASSRGAALLRGRLRRHMRSCEGCRTYAAGVARERRQVAGVLPFLPSLLFKVRTLPDLFAGSINEPTAYAGGATIGGGVAGAAYALAGGPIKAIALKIVVGAAMLGLGAGLGASVTSNQPIARLAGVGGAAHSATHARTASGAARSGPGGAGAGQGLRAGRALGGRGEGAAAVAGGSGAGVVATSGGGGRYERGIAVTSGGGRSGAGSQGTGGAALGGGHALAAGLGALALGVSGRQETRRVQSEQRTQSREIRVHSIEERRQHSHEGNAAREERKRSGEEHRRSATERQAAAERQRVQNERHRVEREQNNRQTERSKSGEKHQREREHEKTRREDQQEREHRAREREHERRKREIARERAQKSHERTQRSRERMRARS